MIVAGATRRVGRADDTPSARYYARFAGQYDLFFEDLAASMEQEGRWLDRVLSGEGVTTVLDASCGAGRQAIPLAQRGYRVTAADPSGPMLEQARAQARCLGVDLTFHELAFTDLPTSLHERFDAVIALGNGLCHQERREDIVASLRAMHLCCRPGGLCLVGIKDFDAIRRDRVRFHGRTARDDGDERIILFEVWDFEDPILVCRASSLRSGGGQWVVTCGETRECMLGGDDVAAAAQEAGFTMVTRLDHPCEAVYALQ
jgi:SAM-dependent methyltransferase